MVDYAEIVVANCRYEVPHLTGGDISLSRAGVNHYKSAMSARILASVLKKYLSCLGLIDELLLQQQ